MSKENISSQLKEISGQLKALQDQINEINRSGLKHKKDIKKLKEDITEINDKLDTSHQYANLSKPFTNSELKNICVKALVQGISLYASYLILGVIWERLLKKDSNNKH
mmetsp:Transcript_3292/g.4059  ORF Transcript_3292/g.4059 Transcript_3292/m.4059 type:complete len:108 (-) Transcript_3292:21-344(-)